MGRGDDWTYVSGQHTTAYADDLSILEPDSLLPGQMPRKGRAWSPEERLVLAVLEIGWRDLQGKGPQADGGRLMAGRRAKLKNDAQLWFRSPLDGPFTYVWCCHALGYEPIKRFLGPSEPACGVRRRQPGPHPNSLRGRLQKAAEAVSG